MTSSIDWCERNYVVNPYIAEFWNSVSNIVIVLVGLWNLRASYKQRYEPRYAILSLGVAVVGVGSFAFHGTLLFSSQIADEVPMIYSILIWNYCLYHIESVEKKHWQSLRASQVIMVIASLGYTVVHIRYALVTSFQLYFAFLVVTGVVLLVKQSMIHTTYSFFPFISSFYRPPRPHHATLKSPHTDSLRTLIRLYFLFLLSGVVVWIIDQNYCTALYNLPFGLPNPQLHAWWHALTGYSHHVGIQFVIGVRQKFFTGRLPVTVWHGGVFPVTTAAGKENK